jgi:hypothetical protein
VKIFLVIAAAAVVLLVASCDVEFRWWTAAGDSNIPAAREVNKVIDAAYRDSLDETLWNLYRTINRADKGTSTGAFVIDHEVPGLAARIDELIPAARQRVAAVQVETPVGQQFRSVVLRGLVRQRLLYRTFAADLAGKRPAWKAFDRWAASFNALHRWYVVQFRSILVAAAFEDRAPVEAALRRY